MSGAHEWTMRTIRRIGRGTFGEVLLAVKEKNSPDGETRVTPEFAVKKIVCRSIPDANSAIQEAFQLRGERHPNIIDYHGLFVEQDDVQGLMVCMEMPYYPAGDLAGYLKATLANPPENWPFIAVEIAKQIASVLDYLHERLYVHRDLKPQNILISTPEEPATIGVAYEHPPGVPHLVLSDFGMLRKVEEQVLTTQCGTPAFMSPEQVHGAYGPPADIWAMGCIIFQLVTLGPPRVMYMEAFKRRGDAFGHWIRSCVAECGWGTWMQELVVNLLHETPLKRPTGAATFRILNENMSRLPTLADIRAGRGGTGSTAGPAQAAVPNPHPESPPAVSDAPPRNPRRTAPTATSGSTTVSAVPLLPAEPFPPEVVLEFPEAQLKILAEHRIEFTLAKFERRMTPLMVAAASGNYLAVRALLAGGADWALQDTCGRLALHHACETRESREARETRERGEPRTEKGKVWLCTRALVEVAPHSITEPDKYGQTPFHVAANNKHKQISGSRAPPAASGEGDCRPAGHHMRELLLALDRLERPASIDLPDLWRRTPLHFVAGRGCLPCCRALLGRRANPALREAKYGSSPVNLADQFKHPQVSELFESYLKANPDLVVVAEREARDRPPPAGDGGFGPLSTTESENPGDRRSDGHRTHRS